MDNGTRYQRIVNIKELLQTSSLANVMKKGLLINEINQQIKKLFPNQFSGLYQVANFDEHNLNILVANAAVRQGFLFRQNELLRKIQQVYPQITQLNFKIDPTLTQINQ